MPPATLHLGDCLDILPGIPDASVDAVICDPPYPEISRPYGRMTEAEWHAMMRRVVPECRRILKPSGSAVFVLQPNSRLAALDRGRSFVGIEQYEPYFRITQRRLSPSPDPLPLFRGESAWRPSP